MPSYTEGARAYEPHTARLFKRSAERTEVAIDAYLPGHLRELTVEDALMKWGIEGKRAAKFTFRLNQADLVEIGDRLLVDGNTWEAVRAPVKKTAVVQLERAIVALVRVE